MNNFNKQNTERLLEMQEEISAIISEIQTNDPDEFKPRGLNHGMTSVCPNCGTTFSLEGRFSNSMYCSTRCKRAAEYKRQKANKKVDPIDGDIKTVKSCIKGIEELSTRYPHHTGSELTLGLLNELLQSLENLKNK